jgi:hypothetical protein
VVPAEPAPGRKYLWSNKANLRSGIWTGYRRGDRGVGGAVAEHGPEDVESAPGQGEHGLDVGFSFKTFSVVVGPGSGAAFSAESPER